MLPIAVILLVQQLGWAPMGALTCQPERGGIVSVGTGITEYDALLDAMQQIWRAGFLFQGVVPIGPEWLKPQNELPNGAEGELFHVAIEWKEMAPPRQSASGERRDCIPPRRESS